MMSMELINLYSNMFATTNDSALLPITFPPPVIFMLIALTACNKHKNLVLGILSLKTSSHIIKNSEFTI